MTRKPMAVIRFEGDMVDISGFKIHHTRINRIEIYGGWFRRHEVFIFEKASVKHPEEWEAPKEGHITTFFNRVRRKILIWQWKIENEG
jgi:hypothetical protein